MNAAPPMGRLPMRRRSLRSKEIVSELQSKPKRRIATGRRRKLRPKRIASGEPRKPKRRIATGRQHRLRPKRIASGQQSKLKRRIATVRRRKPKPKRLTAGGATGDLRPMREAHRAPRTKRPRRLEPKPRLHNSRHRPTIHATKVNSATNGKRKTNGTDLAQEYRFICERARRFRRALCWLRGPTTTGNHIGKSMFEAWFKRTRSA